MTFLATLAHREWAIVAATTRTTANFADWAPGERRTAELTSDGEAFGIEDPLHKRCLWVPSAPFRNVRVLGRGRLSGAVMTGSIVLPALLTIYESIERAELELPSLDAAFQQAAREYMDFDVLYAEHVPRGHVHIAMPGMFGFHVIELRAGKPPRSGRACFGVPSELSGEGEILTFEFLNEVQTPTMEAWQGATTLNDALRAVASAFVRVYELIGPDGTVDDKIELAVMRRVIEGDRWHLEYAYLAPIAATLLRDFPAPEQLLERIPTMEAACR